MLIASTGLVGNSETESTDREFRGLSCATELVLELKVCSGSPANKVDDYGVSDMLDRRTEGERMLWAVIQVRTRVYSNEMTRFSPSMDRSGPLREYQGISILFTQAQREAHRRFERFIRDPFECFFDYTDVVTRSGRSLYHKYYTHYK